MAKPETDDSRSEEETKTGGGIAANAFANYVPISNEVVTPQVFICPADKAKTKNIASDFTDRAGTGFLHNQFQNNALSYIVGLDAVFTLPETILTGDRNIRTSGNKQCGTVHVPSSALYGDDTNIGWTNGIHRFQGHLGLSDGSVQTTTSGGLLDFAKNSLDSGPRPGVPSNDIIIPALPTVIP